MRKKIPSWVNMLLAAGFGLVVALVGHSPNLATSVFHANRQPPISSEHFQAAHVPKPLMKYINMAKRGTLPDPLDPNKLVLWSGGGERFTFLNTVEQNGGQFSIFDVYVPPLLGPPLHIHSRENEWFYVIEGDIMLQHGDKLIEAKPGTLVYGPVNMIHAFENTTSNPARMLLYYEPVPAEDSTSVGNIERFFIEVGQEVVDPFNSPKIDLDRLVRVGPDFGIEFPSSFVFAAPQFTGNEVTILRTGVTDKPGSVVLGLSNGLDIPVNFGIGESVQKVTLSGLGYDTLDLILKNPSEGSRLGLIINQAVLTSPSA